MYSGLSTGPWPLRHASTHDQPHPSAPGAGPDPPAIGSVSVPLARGSPRPGKGQGGYGMPPGPVPSRSSMQESSEIFIRDARTPAAMYINMTHCQRSSLVFVNLFHFTMTKVTQITGNV